MSGSSGLLESEMVISLFITELGTTCHSGLVLLLPFADAWLLMPPPYSQLSECVGTPKVGFYCWPMFTYMINMSLDYLSV